MSIDNPMVGPHYSHEPTRTRWTIIANVEIEADIEDGIDTGTFQDEVERAIERAIENIEWAGEYSIGTDSEVVG